MKRLHTIFLALVFAVGFAAGVTGGARTASASEGRTPNQERRRKCSTGSFEKAAGLLVRRVEFLGNVHVGDMVIRRKVLLYEGEPFAIEKLRKSLEGLNGLGRFYKLTEKDVEWCADEQTHEVDFTFNLKEKPGRHRK